MIKGELFIHQVDFFSLQSFEFILRFCFSLPPLLLIFSGVYSGLATHVPIPNTIVKRTRDDDTVRQSMGK